MFEMHLDDDIENADWPKRSWDLPPYKSEEFIAGLSMSLEQFRTLPVYRHAVAAGLIKDDEWVGPAERALR